MATREDRQLAKLAMELGFATRQQVDETLRILRLRGDIAEPITMDRLLFERKILDAGEIYEVQARTGLRMATCPVCPATFNTFLRKPGSTTSCPRCGHRVPVAGFDDADPFKVRPLQRALTTPASAREVALGVLGVCGVGLILGKALQESWFTHMALWILGASVLFVGLTFALARHKRFMAAAGGGLALVTGLVVLSTLTHGPDSAALSLFGFSAHQLVPPLILLHLVALILLGSSALVKRGSTVTLFALLLPAMYGLAFFTWRSVPSTNPAHYLAGGPDLLPASLPWLLHPGALTLLVLFPLGALVLLFSGVYRLRLDRLARRGTLALSLAALSCLGLAIGTARGEIPSPQIEREVQTLLAGRLASYWTEPSSASPAPTNQRASTAAALTTHPQSDDAGEEPEMVSGSSKAPLVPTRLQTRPAATH